MQVPHIVAGLAAQLPQLLPALLPAVLPAVMQGLPQALPSILPQTLPQILPTVEPQITEEITKQLPSILPTLLPQLAPDLVKQLPNVLTSLLQPGQSPSSPAGSPPIDHHAPAVSVNSTFPISSASPPPAMPASSTMATAASATAPAGNVFMPHMSVLDAAIEQLPDVLRALLGGSAGESAWQGRRLLVSGAAAAAPAPAAMTEAFVLAMFSAHVTTMLAGFIGLTVFNATLMVLFSLMPKQV